MPLLRPRTLLLLCLLPLGAWAQMSSPLALSYSVKDTQSTGPARFEYTFSLELTNADNSWKPGQAWTWIIFGDTRTPTGSQPRYGRLDYFAFTAFLYGPFNHQGYTYGGSHYGPTLIYGTSSPTTWTPTRVGDLVAWRGTSSNNLSQGELLFSNIQVLNNAKLISFQTAARLEDVKTAPRFNAVPEPSTYGLLGAGAMTLLSLSRRRRLTKT